MKPSLAFPLLLLAAGPLVAQVPIDTANQDRANLIFMVQLIRHEIEPAVAAMPATKFGFAPTQGEFGGVRSFGRQAKHLSATNYILASAALGIDPPTDAGDEMGPDSVVTKEQVLAYMKGSFDLLERAARAYGDTRIAVRTSPISPFQGRSVTRMALIVESAVHAFDHYGQMVEYLRMNGIVPPASRR
ncbi:MAG TPA: DinB family protein [Gemmatimonadales bacterium]|nr:DinB family protein [Gemmatimonadales bacterium]